MADVPIYQPSIPVQSPGVAQARAQPMDPSISSAGVYEAAAGIGKTVEEIGSRLEQHMVMQQKLKDQQDDYAIKEKYKTAVQNAIADPQNGLLAKYQGVNSQKALTEFDQMRSGVPAKPGQPGTPAIRDQFLKDASPYQRKQLEGSFDSIDSLYRGKLINHVLEQTEAASKAINEANIDSNLKDGALVTPTAVHDPKSGALIPSITLAEQKMKDTITNDVYFKQQGHPPEVINKLVRDHVDQLAKVAVEANAPKNWQDAQKILNASTASPAAKASLQNHINGARVDQYTEALTKSVTNSPELRAPDGQIDEVKAQAYVNGQIEAQEKSGTPLPPGHADAMVGKIQSQIAIQNKAISQRQQLVMTKASNDIYSAQQSGMAPDAAYTKFIKQGQFDNAIERGKAEDVFTKVYEKDPAALDTVWAHMSETQKNTISQIEGRKDFQDKFSYPDDKKAFIDSFKQKILEGRVQNPDAINKLYMDQIKSAPTGAPRFFGLGKQQLPQYKIDESLQKNQPVVKAVGGLSAASALAQSLGGPDKLAPDTNESKAILLLAKNNYPINKDTISAFITKRPDLLK